MSSDSERSGFWLKPTSAIVVGLTILVDGAVGNVFPLMDGAGWQPVGRELT